MSILLELAVAIGLGLLVGMEREHAKERLAGIRTFPMITVLGALSALLANEFGSWIVVAGFLCVAAMVVLGNLAELRKEAADMGLTTEFAALVMFCVGAALVSGYQAVAVVAAGSVAVLLQWKKPLHGFAHALEEAELAAIARLILIALVIWPLLPNQTYGPYNVLNPSGIWLMVVLIVGISLAAYVAFRLLATRVGTILSGILGGLISSTAVTVAYARQSKQQEAFAVAGSLSVVISAVVVFGRVLFEIAVVAPREFVSLAPPIVAVGLWMALLALGAFFLFKPKDNEVYDPSPPSNLGAALLFGALYAAVLFAAAAAKEHFGERGLMLVAALSGLTDMDAITLSAAELTRSGRVEADLGWRLILTAAMTNLLFKGVAVGLLGSRVFRRNVIASFGLALLGGCLVLFFWP